MSNSAQKRKRKIFTVKKIVNRLEKIVNWLTRKRCFLFIGMPIVSLLLIFSCFSRTSGFLLTVLLLTLYIFVAKKQKFISFGECVLVLFLATLILFGQNNFIKGIKGWSKFIKTTIEESDIEAGIKNGCPYIKKESVPQVNVEGTYAKEEDKAPTDIKKIVKAKEAANFVNNGDFFLPLTDKFSKWGSGLYSDLIKSKNPNMNIFWINFSDVDAYAAIVETEIGNALKIVHSSETAPHKVGIMEQYINVLTPGKYRLSFKAKALDDFEEGAIWFSVRNDWVDPVTIQKKGPFDWKPFSGHFIITEAGVKTFTIISQGKGTVFLTDISLIKVSDKLE